MTTLRLPCLLRTHTFSNPRCLAHNRLFLLVLYIRQLHLVTAVWGYVWAYRLCGPLNVSSAAAWVSSSVSQGVCATHHSDPALWGRSFCLSYTRAWYPRGLLSFLTLRGFSLRLPSSDWVTDPLILSSSPGSKSKAGPFHPFISSPSPPPPLAAPCPLTSAPRAGQMAAICSNIWGYKLASLCVCRLFTNGPAGGPTHFTRCVWISRQQDGNWMDDRLTAANR